MIKKYILWFIFSQILIILLSLIVNHSIHLLSYINVSFIIGGLLLLISLTGFIINKGFFDIAFYSFQHIFSKMTESDRRPLSQLIALNYHLTFVTGILIILFMLIALYFYYA